jgi:hypothetical protein
MRLLSAAMLACATCAAVVAADFTPEAGFKLIFNGKDLTGWQTKAAGKDGKSLPLEGKAEAFDKRFVVKDGELVIDPKVKGDRYIETVQQFSGEITIRFDFKPGDGCNNDILLLGTKFDLNAGKDGKGVTKGLKPNEWNKLEIAVKGGSADFSINGEKAATQKTKGDKGSLTLRAEFGPIAIKNLRATEAK